MKTNKLTDEETQILKKKASEILSVCRRDILTKYPFIGSIALRMNMVPVRDVRVRTACTDGDSVYFDIAFLSSLSDEERVFVLAHEVWHAVLMHLIRRHNRNPQLFNIATDKEVNYMLKEDGFKPPSDLCFPEGDEVGKCAEEIYEMMLKKMKKNMQNMPGNSSNGNGQSSSQSSSKSNQSQKQNKKQNGSGSGSSNGDQDDPNGGNKNGDLKGQFDRHIYDGENESNGSNKSSNKSGDGQPNKNGDGDGDGDGDGQPNNFSTITDKYGEVGLDSDYQPKVPRNFADKMRETVISEANRIEKTKGNLPAHIKALVKKFTTAEIKWQEVLAQFVTRCYNSGNRSWIPPNRRHVHNDIYLQSRQADKIRLCLGIDTSGSTMGDRSKFLGELYSLIKSFGIFDLHIIECDSEVGAYKHYTQDDNLEFDIDNGEYTMSGGGGTAMLPIYNYILDHQIECDCCVIMTDGYIDHIPNNPIPSLPTLWVITKDGTEDFCDWGQKIRLTQSDNDM